MDEVIWSYVSPRHAAANNERDRRPYRRVAHHIRGRVYQIHPRHGRHRALYGMEVINTHTGKVLASDNCAVLAKIVAQCDEVTAAARAAWFWDFKHKAVQ